MNTQGLTAVVVNKNNLLKYEKQLELTTAPIVGINWVENCILNDRFMLPKTEELLPKRKGLKQTKFPKKMKVNEQMIIDNIMMKKDSSDIRFNFLSNIVISAQNYSMEEERLIKVLVAAGGGLYMSSVTFLSTHIVCDYFTLSQENEWRAEATCPKIVSLDWLIYSFNFKKAIKENEYFTKSIPDHLIDPVIPEFNDMVGKKFCLEFAEIEEIPEPTFLN